MLYQKAVEPYTLSILKRLQQIPELYSFYLVERFLIIITNLLIFFLYTALKLLTIAMATLANSTLSKEKI